MYTYHVTWPAGRIGLLMRAHYKDTTIIRQSLFLPNLIEAKREIF